MSAHFDQLLGNDILVEELIQFFWTDEFIKNDEAHLILASAPLSGPLYHFIAKNIIVFNAVSISSDLAPLVSLLVSSSFTKLAFYKTDKTLYSFITLEMQLRSLQGNILSMVKHSFYILNEMVTVCQHITDLTLVLHGTEKTQKNSKVAGTSLCTMFTEEKMLTQLHLDKMQTIQL